MRNLLAPDNSRLLPILIILLSSSLALSLCLRLQTVGCKAPASCWAEASMLVDDDLLLSKGGERVKLGRQNSEWLVLDRAPSSAAIPLPEMVLAERWRPQEIWLMFDFHRNTISINQDIVSNAHLFLVPQYQSQKPLPPQPAFSIGMGDDDIEVFLLPPLLT